MATVYHPTFAEVSYEVPAKKVKDWLKCGWLKTPLKPSGQPDEAQPVNEITPEGNPE